MAGITIRKAVEADFTEVLEMIKALAAFEGHDGEVTNSVEQMRAEQEHFRCVVAEADGAIVGMALWFFYYESWVGRILFLNDMWIKEEYRNKGIGSELMQKIFDAAKEERCKMVRCQVYSWNTPALELYKKLGAAIDPLNNCDFTVES